MKKEPQHYVWGLEKSSPPGKQAWIFHPYHDTLSGVFVFGQRVDPSRSLYFKDVKVQTSVQVNK